MTDRKSESSNKLLDILQVKAMIIDEPLLQNMVDAIVQEVDPETIILFGSRARGDARPDSDVDLLIVEKEPFSRERSRRREASRLYRRIAGFGVDADLLLFSEPEVEEWRHSVNHVVARALREGQVVYARHQARTPVDGHGELQGILRNLIEL